MLRRLSRFVVTVLAVMLPTNALAQRSGLILVGHVDLTKAKAGLVVTLNGVPVDCFRPGEETSFTGKVLDEALEPGDNVLEVKVNPGGVATFDFRVLHVAEGQFPGDGEVLATIEGKVTRATFKGPASVAVKPWADADPLGRAETVQAIEFVKSLHGAFAAHDVEKVGAAFDSWFAFQEALSGGTLPRATGRERFLRGVADFGERRLAPWKASTVDVVGQGRIISLWSRTCGAPIELRGQDPKAPVWTPVTKLMRKHGVWQVL